MNTDAQALRAAAADIAQGWCQGRHQNRDGICAMAAIQLHTLYGPGGYDQYHRVADALVAVLKEQFGDWGNYIPYYNDFVIQSADELVGCLVKAADALEA